ncbi:hypothetical protein [Nonomuraea sp. KM90]|uniref:hypothetical protein n=1 Tax=Nonomuraea sp. KM90 TaxID=3457428 RepID=UPI003FCD49CA
MVIASLPLPLAVPLPPLAPLPPLPQDATDIAVSPASTNAEILFNTWGVPF